MKIKYRILYFLILLSVIQVQAQLQNYDLQTHNDGTDTKTYIGRDYVKLLPGYSYAATTTKSMKAKISSTLSQTDINSLLGVTTKAEADALTTIDTQKAVGEIPISSSVSATGAKCYNVPIEVVPGRNGFQPNISLSYNSQAGNGVMGMGWNIGGLSVIRCEPKNMYYDQVNDVPNITINGVFSLDNIRLVNVKLIKSDANTGILYFAGETAIGNIKTQIEVFILNRRPLKFTAYYPNGTIATFGSINSKVGCYEYPITSLTNKDGSTITYTYDTDNVDLNSGTDNETYYIKKIEYGKATNQAHFASIDFTYEDRPDQIFSLQQSKSQIHRKRLCKIESSVNTNKIRSYQLTYTNTDPRISSNTKDVSRLTQIGSYINDGSKTSDNLNPLKFYYDNSNILNIETTTKTYTDINVDLTTNVISRGNFNPNESNNALMIYPINKGFYSGIFPFTPYKLIYPNNENITILHDLNNPTSIPSTLKSEDGFLGCILADIDNTGSDRIVKINSGGLNSDITETVKFKIYKKDGGQISFDREFSYSLFMGIDWKEENYTSIDYKRWFTGNFTGQGKTEILAMSEALPVNFIISFEKDKLNVLTLYSNSFSLGNGGIIYPLDFDGDGQTEVFQVGSKDSRLYKYKEGSGFVELSKFLLCKNDLIYRQVMFEDLNNDGKMDIVLSPQLTPTLTATKQYDCLWLYLYSDGVSIVKTDKITGLVRSGDKIKYSLHKINGNSTPDLIVQDGSGGTKFYSYDVNLRSFQNSYYSTSDCPANFNFIDYDLNSNFNYTSLVALGSNKVISFSFNQSNAKANKISLMTNSLGIVDKTDYSLLTQGSNYILGSTAIFPYKDLFAPLMVVKQSQTTDSRKVLSNNSFSYAGGLYHCLGLGFCGFTTTTSTDLMTNRSLLTTYDPYKEGSIVSQDGYANNIAYEYYHDVDATSKKITQYTTKITATDKLTGNIKTTTYPLKDDSGKSLYDSYGNPGREIVDLGSGLKTTTDITYKNIDNSTTYLIGLPTERKTTTERDNKKAYAKETFDYYSTDNRLQYQKKYIGKDVSGTVGYTQLSQSEYSYNTDYGTLSTKKDKNMLSGAELTTSYTYWDTDKCSLKIVTDPKGNTTNYSYDFTKRLLSSTTDYLGNSTTYAYDDFRRKTAEYRPDGTVSSVAWNWDLTDPTRVVKVTNSNYYSSTATVNGQQVTTQTLLSPPTYTYSDNLGRETLKETVGLDGASIYSAKVYDNYGRLKTTTAPYKTGETQLTTSYQYDKYDRPSNISVSNGSITRYSYSDNTVTQNKDGVIISKTADASGKTTSTSDGGGTVSYTYRPDGQPETITANNAITSYEYDDNGRQTKIIDPSAGTVETQYDDANKKVTQIENSGKTVEIAYNNFGQPLTKTTDDFVSTYSYDTYGRLTSISSDNGTSKNVDYEPGLGRIWKTTETVSGKTFQKVYGYDKGRLNNVTYNTGSTGSLTQLAKTVNMYNTNGYVYRLEDGNNNRYWEINNVNAAGQETDMLLGNGLSTLKSFSPEGSCTSIKTYNKAGNSNIYQDMAFNFNSITGTLISRTDNVHQLNESFTYDGLLRLTANGPTAYRQTLDYENNGNIKTKSDVGTGSLFNYSDTSKPYTLSNITGVSSSNLTNQLDIDYTVMSRPTTITNSTTGQIATFMYNDDYDRSHMKLQQGFITNLEKYYFSNGQYEIETMGGTDKQRLFLDGTPYTANVVIEKSGANAAQLYYIHRDYLGSITQITDNSANLAAEYSYDAWGRMRDVNTWLPYAQGTQPALLLGRGYTGHEHLSQFGLINMNARLYDPMLARFLAADPKISSSFSNDFNRYVYCRNNPLMYTDPSGESWNSFKAWWVRNISKPFFAECENVYRNGIMFGVSTNTGFSSATGFVALPNGPGIGLQTSNFKNYTPVAGNYQGGFFNSLPLGLEGRMQQSVVQAEQNAKSEYWGQKTVEKAWNSIIETYNVIFTDCYVYGEGIVKQEQYQDASYIFNAGGTAISAGASIDELLSNGYRYKISRLGAIAKPLTYLNYANGAINYSYIKNPSFINNLDLAVGTADLAATINLFGRYNPYIGAATAAYGVGRLGWDYFYKPQQLGPTYPWTKKEGIFEW